jgi:flagellin
VSTQSGAATALGSIETMLQTSIDAASEFGSTQKRVDIQSNFVGKLTDALKAGIGSMVDADMEETSARLQALQVQQQLATQALSIANQAPQNVLSLFR